MVNVTNDVMGSDVSNQRGDVGVVWHDIRGRGCACDLVHSFFSQGIGEENDEEEEQVPSKLCTFYSAR